MAKDFIKRELLKKPIIFQIVLGVPRCAATNYQTLAYLVSQLSKEYVWRAFGIGRSAFPLLTLSYLMGGHIRVGIEDTVYIK